jgi:tRNA A37 threonylcarbamoyladenosine modification protein TsaB
MLGHGAIGAAVVDARRGEMYAAVYKREGLHPRALHGPVLISKQELKPLVENLGARVTLCCSDALAEELEKLTPALVKGSATMSSAAACVTIAWERLHSGNTDDLHALVPLYIRRSDAEEKKSSRMQT